MNKVFAVALREFLATVRTKAFVLSVVLLPGIMFGGLMGMEKAQQFARNERIPLRVLAVVDETGALRADLEAQVARANAERPNQPFGLEWLRPGPADVAALAARVRSGELYGYILVAREAVEGAGGFTLGRKDNQLQAGRVIEEMVREAIYAVRCRAAGLDPARVAELRSRPVPVIELDGSTGGPVTSHAVARALTPFIFMFVLFMGTFGIAQGLLTTVIEEKSSRIVEVLLSAVSPTQLMAGKILGMTAVGFLLVGVWGVVGHAGARAYQVTDMVTGYRLGLAFAYFVPGFLLMAALLAAIGSACNELKDAQGMVTPLSLITLIPMIFWFYLAEHPASLLSVALSFVPPITPFVMVLRVCGDPDTPTWQIVSTLALLWVSVLVAMWAAGKVFRVGVLMYGKPPSLVELARWVRYT